MTTFFLLGLFRNLTYLKRSDKARHGLKRSLDKVSAGLEELRMALNEPREKIERVEEEEVERPRGFSLGPEGQKKEKVEMVNKLLSRSDSMWDPTQAQGGKICLSVDNSLTFFRRGG